MKSIKRVSILTPSYQYGRYIEDALASVREQETALQIEHIVMDGGSSDSTVQVLRSQSVSPERKLVWRSEPDDGQSDALNKAFRLATGDLIGWLNADEFYLPNAINMAREVLEMQGSDAVYGDCSFVDQSGRLVRLVPQHPFDSYVLRHYGCYIASCTFFVRREALANWLWDTTLNAIMDWDLYLYLDRAGARISYLPKPLGAFRVHEDRVTAQRLPQDSPERSTVRRRYDISTQYRVARARGLLGRLRHQVRKVLSGAYWRQARANRSRGVDVRWWQ